MQSDALRGRVKQAEEALVSLKRPQLSRVSPVTSVPELLEREETYILGDFWKMNFDEERRLAKNMKMKKVEER